ncbi:50S ribosomal protein L16 arginine hydroxylase [Pseudoalteromonas rubra]|uniref:50S ribosomal protein L16 arginine hydroxylase n=1 Tax=Pseudoalteromonas rubra TaxID=43658 RepID=A0A4Q7EAU4_9GAMM|nr:cupin domain-containing protein [Pseudoalteromonas rubra]RZM80043.1 50S ribosomal protein L16 arginine hydroxylase [Pseudoalteromonas rubra]
MYQLSLNALTEAAFLTQYWQKKPLLIKQGFQDFSDPLSPEELAGLAMEENIESRIVTNHNNHWDAHHGPFDDFSLLTEQHSTLLVQAVDHWHPQAATLLEPFRFIPNWRIDDLMISFSTPGGGVGPHLDQYDVFIIQGQGKRRWRVGMPDASLKQFAQNKSLLQVEQFEAIIDAELEPGDILYIPPGCPHEGYAVENALNYSVGFRAPDQKDLLSSLADHLIDSEQGTQRYNDPDLTIRDSLGEISSQDKGKIRTMLESVLHDSEIFDEWLGRTLSEPKHEMDLAPLDPPLSAESLLEDITPEDILVRSGGVRALYQVTTQAVLLSVNGQNFALPLEVLPAVKKLTDQNNTPISALLDCIDCLEFKQTLTTLINDGSFYIEDWV